MSKFEDTLAKTREDVTKLDIQIETTLKSLLQDSLLEEAGLIPLLDSKPILPQPIVPSSSGSKLSAKRGLSSKKNKPESVVGGASSQAGSPNPNEVFTAFAVPTSAAPKKAAPARSTSINSIFTPVEAEMFLVPVLDKWIFGATFINSSNTTQKLPYVILNLIDGKGNVTADSQSCVLTYTFKSMLINMEDFSNNLSTIPVQEVLRGDGDNTKDSYCVRKGSKFLVTVCFSHPTLSIAEEVFLIISLCLDSKQVWSKSVEISSRLAISSYNEECLSKFSVEIFTAIGQQTQRFSLETDDTSTDITMSFTDFLKRDLNLNTIDTVQTRFDMKTDTYYTTSMNFLWGSLIQVEIGSRNRSSLRCSISTRTPEQLRLINALLGQWILEKQRNELKMTVTGLPTKKKNEISSDVLHTEVKRMIHFLYLDYRKMFTGNSDKIEDMDVMEVPQGQEARSFNSSNSDILSKQSKTRVAAKWLRIYIEDMSSTDKAFMHISN